MGRKRLRELKSTVSDLFELPKEITLDIPKINLLGQGQLFLENHRGIIEYTEKLIRINTTIGLIRVQGDKLDLKNLATDDILINGHIKSVEFI